MEKLKIGVTGYSAQKFDQEKAKDMLNEAFNEVQRQNPERGYEVVSGLTDLGIPAIAYREGVKKGWRTIGIACSKAEEYSCFPVDEKIIIGKEWGEESQTFLNHIDILIRVGGGNQAKRETQTAKDLGKLVIEYDLQAIKD